MKVKQGQQPVFKAFTDAEKQYIRDNHHNTTVLKMAAHLNRSYATIYGFMDAEFLKVYSSRPDFGTKRQPSKPKRGCFDYNNFKGII